jgi:hypothetical protein
MPKQAKFTVEYFSHDCNYRMTVFTLEQKYKNDGYALWFKLLETLGAARGHYLDFNKDVTLNFLASKAHIEKELCLKIIGELSELEAIDNELWSNYRILWCQNFVDRLAKVYSDRRSPLPPKPTVNITDGVMQITQSLQLDTSDYSVDNSLTADNSDNGSNTADSVGELHRTKGTKLKELNCTKGKKEYAPSVFLTELEYLSLVERFSEKSMPAKLEALSLYKQSSGKQYKSDYFTILNWARKDDEKKDEVVMPKKRFEPGVPDDYDARLKAHVDKIHREQETKK